MSRVLSPSPVLVLEVSKQALVVGHGGAVLLLPLSHLHTLLRASRAKLAHGETYIFLDFIS